MSKTPDCLNFRSRFQVPTKDELKTCGLCAGWVDCQLPQRRTVFTNGRTTYSPKIINPASLNIEDGGKPHRNRQNRHPSSHSAKRK